MKSKVRCLDREVGEVSKVIMDPLSFEVSHLVVSMNGAGERQVPMGAVQMVTDDLVQLRSSSSEVMGLPPFKREDFVTLHEVEVPGLERHIHVTPGEVLVPFPELERNVKRRTFFTKLTYVTGLFIGLPMVFPILKFLTKPMYMPLDNGWLKIGNTGKVKTEDTGIQFQYKRRVKEAYMPEAEIEKNVWIVKATPTDFVERYRAHTARLGESNLLLRHCLCLPRASARAEDVARPRRAAWPVVTSASPPRFSAVSRRSAGP